jgi:hypothetical protein
MVQRLFDELRRMRMNGPVHILEATSRLPLFIPLGKTPVPCEILKGSIDLLLGNFCSYEDVGSYVYYSII